jgi:hypothetical protein
MVMARTTRGLSLDRAARAKQARITKALSELGLALPGSVEVRSTRCGKVNCRCKAEPAHLHGPYIVWTRKVDAKTVTRVLSPEQLDDYRPMLENAKRLRELVTELQNLTLQGRHRSPLANPLTPPDGERPHHHGRKVRKSTVTRVVNINDVLDGHVTLDVACIDVPGSGFIYLSWGTVDDAGFNLFRRAKLWLDGGLSLASVRPRRP